MTRTSVLTVIAALLFAVALYGIYSVIAVFVDGPSDAIFWAYEHWSPMAGDTDDTGGPVAFVLAIGLASIALLWCSLALLFRLRLGSSNADSANHGKPRT